MHGALSNTDIVTCDKAKWQQSVCDRIRLGSTVVCGGFWGCGGGWFVIDCLTNPRLIQRSISRFNYTDSGDNAKSSVNFMPVWEITTARVSCSKKKKPEIKFRDYELLLPSVISYLFDAHSRYFFAVA